MHFYTVLEDVRLRCGKKVGRMPTINMACRGIVSMETERGEDMEEEKRITTEELLKLLFKEKSLEHFLRRNESAYQNITFSEYLSSWCKSHGEVPEHVIRRANLEKSFGHQLFSGKRKPSRDTVIQLAFAMGADVDTAQEMLRIARKSLLYPRIKRDTVIIYCLHNGIGLLDTEIILQDLGLPILGGRDQ